VAVGVATALALDLVERLAGVRRREEQSSSALAATKPVRIQAGVWKPALVIAGTKKLQIPSPIRTTATISPCAGFAPRPIPERAGQVPGTGFPSLFARRSGRRSAYTQ
jgi:hypothetical protein